MPRQWSNGWISLLRTSQDPNTKCCGIGYGICQLWCCHLWIGCALVPWSHPSRSEKPFNLSPRSIVATQAPRDLSHEVPNHMISAWTQKSIAANWHWKKCSQVFRHELTLKSSPLRTMEHICSYTSGTKATNGQENVASTNSNMELAVWCSVRAPCEQVIWPRYIGTVWPHALAWLPLRSSSHRCPSTCKVAKLEFKKISDQTRKMAGSD